MKLAGWTCAAATAALGIYAAPAYAEAPRSVFCMATRTTPKLDQNNYVAGASGQVYATRNFTTGLPEEVLVPMWRAFIVAKHPAKPGGDADDTCYPANARRTQVSTYGDVKTLTVKWAPAQ